MRKETGKGNSTVSVNETSGLKVHSNYERMIPDSCGLAASW